MRRWENSCRRIIRLYEENERLKRERNEMLDGYNKFKALQKEKQEPLWESSLKKQRIMTHVSLVVWPRRFGKTTNLTMLKEFFSIPIYPDNENYYRELFRDTKIMERSCLLDSHFCKYLVIFLSLKGFDVCDTWLKMEALLCQELASLYKEHGYINDILDNYEKLRFNKILSGNFEHAVIIKSLEHLSKYLRTYHRRRCIVLVDEYDHPMEIAYRYQYYEKARGFFSSLFGALLKKERLNEVKEWYDGYKAGNGICLYNPWSINQFIDTNTLDAHWVNTGGTATIKKLLWHSTKDFKKETLTLLKKDVIDVKILKDIDYNTLSPRVIWTLLYYEGYLTMNEDKNLCIPNIKVFTEWKEWLNNRISSNPDIMLEMLLQCNLTKFEEELPTMIMESLSYLDTINSNLSYHFLMIGILSPVRYHNYELLLNREAGEGRFDVKIVPITENVIYPILIIMEFKVYKKNKKIIDNDEYGDEDEDKTEH
uniref:AAA-ATPase-like domain-containing protein n=1 Tax=Rhizophagus irregularis (strain DAOM 181602 / DAOM 197198 / MUCL 43194) TaxID=747089 RepID=U9SXY4_RHIID